jgi:hypothetical protein
MCVAEMARKRWVDETHTNGCGVHFCILFRVLDVSGAAFLFTVKQKTLGHRE